MTIFATIYDHTKETVSSLLPLPDDWIKSKCYEASLAKSLLVHLLTLQGFSRRMIEYYTTLSKSSVKQYENGYAERVKTDRTLRILEYEARKELGL